MNDLRKTKSQLVAELVRLRARVAELEASRPDASSGAPAKPQGPAAQARAEKASPRLAANLPESSAAQTPPHPLADDQWPSLVSEATLSADHARVEGELSTSKAILQAAIDSIPFDFGVLGPSGTYVLQNATCKANWGESIGRRPEEICTDPQDLATMQANHRRAMCGEKVEGEVELTIRGERRFCHHVTVPIWNEGRVWGVLGLNVDVTERKQAEDRLRSNERTLRALMDASPESMFLMTPDGTVLMANETAAQRLSTTVAEMIGRVVYTLLPAELADSRSRLVAEVIRTRKPIRLEDTRAGRTYESAVHPIMNERGEVTSIAVLGIDRTERKRAEEALRKAHDELEEKVKQRTAELAIFRSFAEASDQAFGIADLAGHATYVNPALCRMSGRAVEEILGKPVVSFFPEALRGKVQNEIISTVLRDGRWSGESFFPTLSGECKPTFENHFLIRDQSGHPAYLAGVITDVSSIKEAERKLAQSEEKYRTLVEASPDGVLMADMQGRLTYASSAVLAYHGAQCMEEVLGRDPTEFVAPEDRPRFLENLQRIREKNVRNSVEYTFLKKDGTSFPGEISTAVVRDSDGEPQAMVAVLRDISERKAAEAALRQSRDELQAIYDGMTDGVTVEDLETRRVVRVNAAFQKMLGYDLQELPTAPVERFHPSNQAADIMQQYKAHVEGRMTRSEAIPFVCRDGSTRYLDINTRRILYDGRPCMVCFFHDITERKQVQDALRRERQSLWRMLQASDHERQVLSYEIHDGLAQYLSSAWMQFQNYNAWRKTSPAEARKAYKTAVELVRQAHFESRRLISDVRPPIIDENGLDVAISHLVHEHRRRGGPSIKLDSDVHFGRLSPVLENTLYRIVQEALSNACTHSKSKKVSISLAQEGSEVCLKVQDWGIGFHPESVEKGHFGLEGIRQRVRLLGGRLTIESSPGSGTTVEAVVPLLEEPTTE